MSAEVLRKAATAMRSENVRNDRPTSCHCEFTDHWFDRSICPEPCGSMHDICVDCGRVKGRCLVAEAGRDNGNRLAVSWLAVADWLDEVADKWGDLPHMTPHALAVATAYLGGDQ